MKAYTDREQSKKLAEILPIESADMWWNFYSVTTDDTTPQIIHLDTPWVGNFNWDNKHDNVPCWSLAALLNNIPQAKLDNIKQYNKKHWRCCAYFASDWHNSDWHDNPIDACYEMILKLHELKNKQ